MSGRRKSEAPEEPPPPPAPPKNPELIGQAAAEARLLEAWRSGRLPHAWLLSGPRGIGKATLAYRMARWVLAGGPAADDGQAGLFGAESASADGGLALDPEHPAFRQVAAGAHPDLFVLQRTPNPRAKTEPARSKPREEIVVEDARGLPAFLHKTAVAGGWRVVVVDAADELNRHAANAILKAIEEPPRKSLILLVCHAPGRLLPTIRSRCCQLPLRRLDAAEIEDLMARHRPEIEAGDRAALARLAEGSAGRAFALADGGGLALYRDMIALLERLPGGDAAALHGLADKWARDASGESFRTGMELLIWWLGRLIHARAVGQPPDEVLPGEAALLARLGARPRLEQWLALWDKISRLLARAGALSLDRKQVVLTAFFELEALTG